MVASEMPDGTSSSNPADQQTHRPHRRPAGHFAGQLGAAPGRGFCGYKPSAKLQVRYGGLMVGQACELVTSVEVV